MALQMLLRTVIYGNKDPSEISHVMKHKLKCLNDWIRANKLSLNKSKTKVLIFRSTSKLSTTIPSMKLNEYLLAPGRSLS